MSKNDYEESPEEYYDRLVSKWDTIANRAELNDTYQKIQEIAGDLDDLEAEIDDLRANGYVYHGEWEESIKQLQKQWPQERRTAEKEYKRQVESLQDDAEDIEDELQDVKMKRSKLSQLESEMSAFEQRVDNAEERVNSTFSRTDNQMGDIYEMVEWAQFLLDNLRDATFKLRPNEHGVAAAKAEWAKSRKEPEGILYLTNQRILFEQVEEKATKKILFITTEKEIIRELMWEVPVGAIQKSSAEDKGGLIGIGVKEMLTLHFSRDVKVVPEEVQLRFRDYADNEWWEELIDSVKSGRIEKQKHSAGKGEKHTDSPQPAATAVPTICVNCGGQLPTLFKGMQHLECEFCGTAVNLNTKSQATASVEK